MMIGNSVMCFNLFFIVIDRKKYLIQSFGKLCAPNEVEELTAIGREHFLF